MRLSRKMPRGNGKSDHIIFPSTHKDVIEFVNIVRPYTTACMGFSIINAQARRPITALRFRRAYYACQLIIDMGTAG